MAYPTGAAGPALSIQQIAQRIREGMTDAGVQGWAFDELAKAGFQGRGATAGTTRQRAAALLDAVRVQILYAADPPNVEMVKSAATLLCLRPGLCIRGGDCFPRGTLLLRSDYVLVPIEEIRVGDQIWGRDAWTTVDRILFKGQLRVDAIDLNNGSTIHLTGDHKVYVGRCKHGKSIECPSCQQPSLRQASYERVHVSDLQEGETLLQPERIAYGSEDRSPDLEYITGLYLSEGWCEENRFAISGADGCRKEALKHEVKAICDRLGVSTYWARKYIRINDAVWTEKMSRLGTRARFKRAGSLNLTEPAAAALLRGIMSDSTANTRGDGRTYSTTSRTLMIQVRVLQRMAGVSTSVRMLTPEQHGGAGKHNLWRVGVRGSKKALAVKAIERAVRTTECWDITTNDHYVYLPEHDVTVSNCDDQIVLLGSALMSVGIPARILKQTFGAEDQEHVLIEAEDENGNWFPMDPSTDFAAGVRATATSEVRIDPTNPQETGLTGTPEAEFIGVGAMPGSRLTTEEIATIVDRYPYDVPIVPTRPLYTLIGGGMRRVAGAQDCACHTGVGECACRKPLDETRPTGVGATPVGVGLVTIPDVDQIDQELDAGYNALNPNAARCLTASDFQSFLGVLFAWDTLHQKWADLRADLPWYEGGSLPAMLSASDIYAQMLGYREALTTWQQRTEAACATVSKTTGVDTPYVAPPALPTPAPQPTVGDTATQIAKAAAVVVGVGVAGYAAIELLRWLDVLRPARKAAAK
jgi:hypothetical protein